MPDLPLLRSKAGIKRNWLLFMLAGIFLGLASGTYDPTFNNYLNDVFHISSGTRGLLEMPREAPGLGIALVTALLALLPEARSAVIAVSLWTLGTIGVGLLSPGLGMLIFWMIVGSMGQHLWLPLSQVLGVEVAAGEQVGRKLGLLSGANTAAVIAGAGIVWSGTRFLGLNYTGIFVISAACSLLAAAVLLPMRLPKPDAPKLRFIYKRRYNLFYLLSVLYGARKQLFITFGPWVLIKVFQRPPATIALLLIVSSGLGVLFRPLLGRLIDALGERKILMGEALALVFVCLGYALSQSRWLASHHLSLALVYTCYVIDQLLAAAGMARTTYLCKIADEQRDLTPTLSLGTSIDHVFSITIAAVGGLVWAAWGYQYVFLGAAGIAVLNLCVARRVCVTKTVAE